MFSGVGFVLVGWVLDLAISCSVGTLVWCAGEWFFGWWLFWVGVLVACGECRVSALL